MSFSLAGQKWLTLLRWGQYLCDRADPIIPCELLRGYLDYMPHAWNVVHVENKSSIVRLLVDGCRPLDIRQESDPEYFCRYNLSHAFCLLLHNSQNNLHISWWMVHISWSLGGPGVECFEYPHCHLLRMGEHCRLCEDIIYKCWKVEFHFPMSTVMYIFSLWIQVYSPQAV